MRNAFGGAGKQLDVREGDDGGSVRTRVTRVEMRVGAVFERWGLGLGVDQI